MRRLVHTLTIVGISMIVVGVGAFLWLRFGLFGHACDQVETVLSRDSQSRTVVDVSQACTAIGTSTEEWVELVSSTGRRVRVLTFVPWGGEYPNGGPPVNGPFLPSVTWISSDDLQVSIGTVQQVLQQRTKAAGVRITYDIGTDLSKWKVRGPGTASR